MSPEFIAEGCHFCDDAGVLSPARTVAAVVSAALLVGGCTSGAPVRLPGTVEPVNPVGPALKDVGRSTVGAFEWSAERRLTWADFQGPPDLSSEAVATTATVVDYQMSCLGTEFTWRIVSRFMPGASWVKPGHLLIRQSAQTLLHEQAHFDLSEVHARRARETLRRLPAPCSLTDDQQDAIIKSFHQQGGALQIQYDRETAHGTDYRRQNEWQSRVEEWLREK